MRATPVRVRFASILSTILLGALAGGDAAAKGPSPASDPAAVSLAEKTLEVMGGREAWEKARVLRWEFFGRRLHHWDKWTADVCIETDSTMVLMNLHTKKGRAWRNGAEVISPSELHETLEQGYAQWVNDSYWLVMPYKLLDPGVRLQDGGTARIRDDRPARRLIVTFESDTGLTPQNKYHVFIDDESGLVEEWAYFERASDETPKFTRPWLGWKKFGNIMLATIHDKDESDWRIAVFDERPPGVFEAPE